MSYLFLVSPDVVGIGSEYFVDYLSCVYICSADHVELPVILYLLQCLVHRMLSKWKEALEFTYRVIVEVLVLGLLVVVYKIPYSSCSYVNQVRCNWCVPMLLLSSCGIVYSRVQKTPASEKKEDVRISHQTENQKEILVYVPGTYIPGIPFCSSSRRRCEL